MKGAPRVQAPPRLASAYLKPRILSALFVVILGCSPDLWHTQTVEDLRNIARQIPFGKSHSAIEKYLLAQNIRDFSYDTAHRTLGAIIRGTSQETFTINESIELEMAFSEDDRLISLKMSQALTGP
jgi:hypothetical protein